MSDRPGGILRVEAPHYCAGAIVERNDAGRYVVVRAAPILRWSVGRAARSLAGWCERKSYRWQWIDANTKEAP